MNKFGAALVALAVLGMPGDSSNYGGEERIGPGGFTMADGSHSVFPSDNDPATPTIAFGDADSGIYETADDTIAMGFATARKWLFNSNRIESDQGNGAAILNEISTTTNPTLIPRNGDLTMGYGGGSTGPSLIVSGAEVVRAEAAAFYLFAIQKDVGATCTTGELAYDTGGATDELCFCQTTDTWTCWSATTTAGPTD